MINGAHAVLYSDDADATRAALAKVLGTRSVDAGDGWFDLPPPPGRARRASAEEGGWAELYPLCHDVAVTVTALRAEGSTWPGRSATRAGGCCGHRVPPSGSSSASISPATRPRPSRVERTTVRGHPGRQHQRVCAPGARVQKQVITRDGRVGQ